MNAYGKNNPVLPTVWYISISFLIPNTAHKPFVAYHISLKAKSFIKWFENLKFRTRYRIFPLQLLRFAFHDRWWIIIFFQPFVSNWNDFNNEPRRIQIWGQNRGFLLVTSILRISKSPFEKRLPGIWFSILWLSILWIWQFWIGFCGLQYTRKSFPTTYWKQLVLSDTYIMQKRKQIRLTGHENVILAFFLHPLCF